MAEIEDHWLSVDEIGKCLGVSNDTVYKWIDKHSDARPSHGPSLEVQERLAQPMSEGWRRGGTVRCWEELQYIIIRIVTYGKI